MSVRRFHTFNRHKGQGTSSGGAEWSGAPRDRAETGEDQPPGQRPAPAEPEGGTTGTTTTTTTTSSLLG